MKDGLEDQLENILSILRNNQQKHFKVTGSTWAEIESVMREKTVEERISNLHKYTSISVHLPTYAKPKIK